MNALIMGTGVIGATTASNSIQGIEQSPRQKKYYRCRQNKQPETGAFRR